MELLNRRIIERVIDTMSRAPGVRVLAYNTVQHQRGKDLDSRSLGENLLVNAIAVGEMIRHNDELLLHVGCFVDAAEGRHGGRRFKEIIPMVPKIPTPWPIRIIIGCGQISLLPGTA